MAQKKFGRFEIRSLLGKGAMGAVFKAHDPMLKRDVAIKVVRFPKELAPEQLEGMKQGLLKEARMAAGLSHPGIVQVYDAGEQNGQPFVVLELIHGNLLSTLLKEKGALDFKQTCYVFKELLSAMSYAHERGIVHLDLKPANIMIGKNWQPRIMDFGIARSVADLRGKNADIAGTPRFMAPEQIIGGKLDTRADVFSLGVIFYFMLSGHLPFPSEDFNTLKRTITKEPHPPLQSYQSDLPKPYYEFIDRALSKTPSDRFASGVAMLQSFNRCLESDAKTGEGPGEGPVSEGARQEILRFIMQRIKRKGDFPAVSQYVSEVVRAARSPNTSAQSIAQTILKDISLTNRVLRIANSAYYQGYGSPITTISRAVVVLGMDAILNMTSALGIFEHFLKKGSGEAQELKRRVLEALFTALNAREIANHIGMENSEEPFICGMLQHLGQLIVCFYFPEEENAINEIMRQDDVGEEEASRKVMRLSYTELGQAIADSWKLPKLLHSGLKKLDLDRKGPLQGNLEKLQGVTSYAYELSKVTMITDKSERKVALANLARKFEGKINIKPKVLEKIINDSVESAGGFSKTLRLSLKELGLTREDGKDKDAKKIASDDTIQTPSVEDTIPLSSSDDTEPQIQKKSDADETIAETLSAVVESESSQDEEGEPDQMEERQEFLTKTIADIAMTLTDQFSISDVIMMVLEGMYRGLGMRNVLLAMITPKRDRLVFRFGLGPETEQLRTDFDFPLKYLKAAPVQSVLKQQELIIFDMEKNNNSYDIPKKLLKLLDPRSIIFLPVVVKNKPIGLFAAMRSKEQAPITELELQSMRMLSNQCVLALHQSTRGR